jgi:antitoxin (DNA-binding transcriptional repressor) of toxin-antitoxin stability system
VRCDEVARCGLDMAMLQGHVKAMTVVNISELKNRLSYYLSRARRGETLLVRDRDRVIARIEPAGESQGTPKGDAEWLRALEDQGVIRRRTRKLPGDWLDARPGAKADVVRTLLRERQEGR